jgi:hypothetical protein
VTGQVEHVEAAYENGRMVFHVSVNLAVRVSTLDALNVITQAAGIPALEAQFVEVCSTSSAPRRGRRRCSGRACSFRRSWTPDSH